MQISFSRIDCSGNELSYIHDVLKSGWITTASVAKKFENNFVSFIGAKHACAVNSCTSALHLALEAIGVAAGDRVIVPTLTFTASAEVVRYLGADPIFVDVDYDTKCISPNILRKALEVNQNISAIIVVHYGGMAAEMLSGDKQGIIELCKQKNIKIVEDAAHAFPAKIGSQFVGTFGDVTCFSFYANKTITTAEGGMLVTNHDYIEKRARLMSLHGIDRDVWSRFIKTGHSSEYDVIAPGFKYNMSDINAAIGMAQLERAEKMREARQLCAEIYNQSLRNIDCIDLPTVTGSIDNHAWHLYPIVLNQNAKISRDILMDRLAQDGIGTSIHYKPLHRMTYYKNKYDLVPEDFPNAERVWKGCLSLPIYSLLSEKEILFIIKRVKFHLNANK